jgi:nucleotide-binding universal stress UspA family protein
MENKKILVPVDFTEASENSITSAVMIATEGLLGITLLHIDSGKKTGQAEQTLKEICEKQQRATGVAFGFKIRKGSVLTEIAKESNSLDYKLMIIGSHGVKGVREKFFGTDILKLMKNIPIPCIVVQKDYKVPIDKLHTIVFPASTHEAFKQKVKTASYIAGLFNARIHLYTVEKPGVTWPDKLQENLAMAMEIFDQENIEYVRVNEEQSGFSTGYSKQILDYARRVGADLISIISVQSKEFFNIADADKESLLTNSYNIPILCTSDKKVV